MEHSGLAQRGDAVAARPESGHPIAEGTRFQHWLESVAQRAVHQPIPHGGDARVHLFAGIGRHSHGTDRSGLPRSVSEFDGQLWQHHAGRAAKVVPGHVIGTGCRGSPAALAQRATQVRLGQQGHQRV